MSCNCECRCDCALCRASGGMQLTVLLAYFGIVFVVARLFF
jgi:hypothetical protein